MADGLVKMGVKAEPTTDGIVIEGGTMHGAEVVSHGDHRIAMSFAMAALRTDGEMVINDCANVNTSFPSFVALAAGAGLNIK